MRRRGYDIQRIGVVFLLGLFLHTPSGGLPARAQPLQPEPQAESEEVRSPAGARLLEELLASGPVLSRRQLDALAERARMAAGGQRLSLLYRRMRASLAFHDRALLERTAADLRRAAVAAQRPSYIALAEVYAAYARSFSGEIHAALEQLEAIAERSETNGDWLTRGSTMQFIAALAPAVGQVHRAAKALQDGFALELPQSRIEARMLRADLYFTLGLLDAELGNLDTALAAVARALALARQYGFHIDRVAMLYNVANLDLRRGAIARARRLFTTLADLARDAERPKARFYALYGLMKAEQAAGNPAASAAFAQRALEIYRPPPHFAAAVAQHQVSNMIALGRLPAAHRQLEIAERYLEQWPDLAGTRYAAENIRLRARLAEAEGRYAEALRLFRDYAARRQEITETTFNQDVRALRARMERDLAAVEAARALALREKAVARDRLRVQRLWLVGALVLVLATVAGFLYQRRMARALDESRRRAEEANAAKSRFLANISHELRTPLNAIIGFSEISAGEMLGPLGNESYRTYAQAIHRSGRHLLAVINDILDISRIEAGRCELEEEEIRLSDVVEQAVELVHPQLESKRQDLCIEGLDSLPTVLADPRLLRQCLSNLISNASKFSTETAQIRIRGRLRPGDGTRLSVIDNGIGMRPEEIETALEPFGQVESVFSRAHEGSGLGLPIVKSFIELHGGRMEIESEPGRGTAIHLHLPIERVCRPEEADSRPRVVAASA